MLVPLKWLKEFVDHDLTPQQVAEVLTMAGLEVDGVEERFPWAGKVVTARVVGVEPHPNADRLRLARVETGQGEEVIVCGAPNLRPGMVGALALPGAVLGEGMEVRAAKIRGVESRGMLCSARELGISDDHSGILELDQGLAPGQDLIQALGLEDLVLEISITPNRGDALSVLGVARDLAAVLGLPLRLPEITLEEHDPPTEEQAQVVIHDPQGCPRYVARLVRGVEIGPSPLWLADRVMACGMRPINNVVDITNYVLMELGQPLHAFDFHLLKGGRIEVRQAAEGEVFTTLDGQERRLQGGMLLICDAERPVALAGVMGGLNSEIQPDTQDVLIESAFFDPTSIRRTSKRLGLTTEASYRFERAIDISGCARAAARAAQLMAQVAGGQVARGEIDAYPRPHRPPRISLSVRRTAAYLGVELTRPQVSELLRRLEIQVEEGEDPDTLVAIPPAARTDLTRPVDLGEEVARLVGFDRIPARMPRASLASRPRAWEQRVRERVRDLLAAAGLNEAITLSFAHPQAPDWLRLPPDDPRRRAVKLLNPLAEDQSVMRTSLLPGLLRACRHNLAHRVADVALFELGKVFIAREGEKLPQEPTRLAGVMAGLAQPVSWWSGEKPVSLAHLRGAVEYLCEGLGLGETSFPLAQPAPPYFEPGVCCRVQVAGQDIGELGKLHPKVAAAWDIDQPVYAFDLDLDRLAQLVPHGTTYQPLPRYPAVVRDVAVVVKQEVGAGEVVAAARELLARQAPQWQARVEMFDLYRGKPLARDQKSLGLRFHYRSPERTLTEEEVIPVHQAVVEALLERFGGTLRQ